MSYQKIIVLGRLGKDPEVRYTQSGKAVCKFSVAVDDGYGDKKTTTWFNVVCFDKLAETCSKHLAKGREALVDGRIKIEKYKDKDGNDRTAVELVAFTVQFVGGKGERSDAPARSSPSNDAPPASDGGFIDDELPFARFDPVY